MLKTERHCNVRFMPHCFQIGVNLPTHSVARNEKLFEHRPEAPLLVHGIGVNVQLLVFIVIFAYYIVVIFNTF